MRVLQTFTLPDAPETVAFDSGGILLVGNGNGTISEYALEEVAGPSPPATGPTGP
jgi:hypothetical protein